MIVKDEELVIARCLDSVKHIVDEIIIVDTGSIDDTKKLLKIIQLIFMISIGLMILQQLEIFLFPKQQKIIFYG